MSILIKGMEMPKSCESCPCKTADAFGGLGCQATGYIPLRKANQDRPDNCPLVPVPPHGRLIDADALASEMEKQISNQDELMELCKSAGDTKNYFNSSKVQIGMVSFLRALNDSPTIIPAEEGE